MEEKQVPIFNEIFKALENASGAVENSDGIEALSAILNLSNEDFEILKAPFLANIEDVFNQQDTKIAFAEMI